MAHGCWGVWCLAKGLGFYRRFGWAPFDLERMWAIDARVPRRWLREFGLYLLSELCWAAAVRDWPMFAHHVPLLLFYKFAQEHAVTHPMLISVVEVINIPVGLEGLMRWQPSLYSSSRATCLRRLKVAIVIGRMMLNNRMLAMTRATSKKVVGHDRSQRRSIDAIRRAVMRFTAVWLLLDLNLLRQLLPQR